MPVGPAARLWLSRLSDGGKVPGCPGSERTTRLCPPDTGKTDDVGGD